MVTKSDSIIIIVKLQTFSKHDYLKQQYHTLSLTFSVGKKLEQDIVESQVEEQKAGDWKTLKFSMNIFSVMEASFCYLDLLVRIPRARSAFSFQ